MDTLTLISLVAGYIGLTLFAAASWKLFDRVEVLELEISYQKGLVTELINLGNSIDHACSSLIESNRSMQRRIVACEKRLVPDAKHSTGDIHPFTPDAVVSVNELQSVHEDTCGILS